MTRIEIAVLTAAIVALPSCRQGGNKTPVPQADDSVTETVADTVYYSRTWKNPSTFVMGAPSQEKILEWQNACEKLNPQASRFVAETYLQPLDSYVTFWDLDEVRYQNREAGYTDDFAFMCWRLNELCPMGQPEGECARYDALQAQMDSMCAYIPEATFEIIIMSGTVADFEMMRADWYGRRLGECMLELKVRLDEERAAFHRYMDMAQESFYRIVMGDPSLWGTISSFAICEFKQMVAHEYADAIIPAYLRHVDSAHFKSPERHSEVTDEMIGKAYDLFLNSLKEPETGWSEDYVTPEEFTLASQKAALVAERIAWNEWMRCRKTVSEGMSGMDKRMYDKCTNEVMRSHLISLLNRYTEADIRSEIYFDILLKRDCTDRELHEYDYDKSYEQWLK